MKQLLQLDSHDLALWLLNNLRDARAHTANSWIGYLPDSYNFAAFEAVMEKHQQLAGLLDSSDRSVEFYPSSANVYESVGQLLSIPANRERAPGKYSIRALNYSSSRDQSIPEVIQAYVSASQLCKALKERADVPLPDSSLLFVKSHSERLRLTLGYQEEDLSNLPDMRDFFNSFVESEHHKEQKKSVIRQALLDLFKGSSDVRFGLLLQRLHEFISSVKASYAMYMAEFTLEKVKAEIEKDNLDSAVKLGKAVSDIQNQILAMPAALLLVGSQMEEATSMTAKNLTLLFGAMIFTWFMDVLIRNQQSTVDSIDNEVQVRQKKVNDQPPLIVEIYKGSFTDLATRIQSQRRTLKKIKVLVVLGLIISILLFVWVSSEKFRACIQSYLGV
ncbi:hypothetical protein ABE501_05420 [Comamonas testosteroni]